MAANLIIDPDAEEDIDRAYGWYEMQRVGLGEEFLGCVDACIELLRRSPTMHRTIHGPFRRALVRRFPYAVYYEYTEASDTVTVYVVIHTARSPDEWRGRLP